MSSWKEKGFDSKSEYYEFKYQENISSFRLTDKTNTAHNFQEYQEEPLVDSENSSEIGFEQAPLRTQSNF